MSSEGSVPLTRSLFLEYLQASRGTDPFFNGLLTLQIRVPYIRQKHVPWLVRD
jgi:hypothetical protein